MEAEDEKQIAGRWRRRESPAWLHGVYAGVCLYLFLCAINIMGAGLKTIGQASDWMERVFAYGDNPFIALLGSVLVTATVQSSSFTTALIITLVAAGQLDLHAAVYAIMGANIGTAVTGVIVSLGSIRIRRHFRRAFTAALLHDFFNILTVALLFPLEWISSLFDPQGRGLLMRWAMWLSEAMGMDAEVNPRNPVKIMTQPMVDLFSWLGGLVTWTDVAHGLVVAAAGLLLLFIALVFMVKNLKGALVRRLEGLFRSVFFRNDATSYVVGVISTIMVQASTITTTIIVPLAGAGIVPLRRVFAFMLGANLGTTVTGVIAATAHPVAAAVTVALFHVNFNLIGTVIWYPLQRVPVGMAGWYGRLASKSKRYAFLFLFLVFVVIPVVGLFITELFIVRE
jgi:solute carrier family 34 (sodium-dependent phosphate cotransporter)